MNLCFLKTEMSSYVIDINAMLGKLGGGGGVWQFWPIDNSDLFSQATKKKKILKVVASSVYNILYIRHLWV